MHDILTIDKIPDKKGANWSRADGVKDDGIGRFLSESASCRWRIVAILRYVAEVVPNAARVSASSSRLKAILIDP